MIRSCSMCGNDCVENFVNYVYTARGINVTKIFCCNECMINWLRKHPKVISELK